MSEPHEMEVRLARRYDDDADMSVMMIQQFTDGQWRDVPLCDLVQAGGDDERQNAD